MSELNLAGDWTLTALWAGYAALCVLSLSALCWYGWRRGP